MNRICNYDAHLKLHWIFKHVKITENEMINKIAKM